MNKLILALTLTVSSSLALAGTIEEHKLNIRRLTDRIYDEVAVSKVDAEKLQQSENHLRAALAILQGAQAPDAYDRNKCIKFILDLNYSPNTATATCDAITTSSEFSCVRLVVGKNSSPQTAVTACQGIKPQHLDCFADMLERNYSPTRAREVCVR